MLGKALPLKCELGVVRDRDGELSAPFTKASTQRRPVMQLSVAQKQGNENIGRFERDQRSIFFGLSWLGFTSSPVP